MKLIKTSALVLSQMKYKDTSLIVRMFTEKLGLRSYIINGVRSEKVKGSKIALFQPLNWLEMVVYENPNHSLHRISEVKVLFPYQTIPYNHHKTLIAIFLADFLGSILKEEEANEKLFEFLKDSLKKFDLLENHFADFHLQFLLKTPDFLGFAIEQISEIKNEVPQWEVLENQQLELLQELLIQDFGLKTYLSGALRTQILELLLLFFQKHIEGFGEIYSLNILKELN
jgi:DNA repair protein RecO (recombination protein O)